MSLMENGTILTVKITGSCKSGKTTLGNIFTAAARAHGLVVHFDNDSRDASYQDGAVNALVASGAMVQIAEESHFPSEGFDPSTLLACQMLRDLHDLLNTKRAEIASLKQELENAKTKA